MKKTITAALLVIAAVGIFSTRSIAIIQSAEAYVDPNTFREPKATITHRFQISGAEGICSGAAIAAIN
jgi:hypothetical protein